jgi:hypothetical protein
MKNIKRIFAKNERLHPRAGVLFLFCWVIFCSESNALEHKWDGNTARLTATGSAGVINPDDKFDDFLIRAQLSREMLGGAAGAVYAIDALAYRGGYYARDAFLYFEGEYGRIETGWTEPISSKLALVLPDAGGMRLNNSALFYPSEFAGITNPAVRGGQYAWRANLATMPTNPWQFGFGQSLPTATFDFSTDVGVRYRNGGGRTKTSLSAGLSYINNPHGMSGDNFLPPVFAAARYQGTIGFNVQRGSLVLAMTAKAVLDDSPAGFATDGLQLGAGASYEFLSWSASAGYIFSDVGVWRGSATAAHTGVISAKYKVSGFFNIWGSIGSVRMPGRADKFVASGFGVSF